MSSAGEDSEEIILDDSDMEQALDDLASSAAEEELDAGVHEAAAMDADMPRAAADSESEADEEGSEDTTAVVPPPQQTAAALAAAADILSAAPEQPPAAGGDGAPPPAAPRGLGLGLPTWGSAGGSSSAPGAGAGAGGVPRGMGGMGLQPPRAAGSSGGGDAGQQQPAAQQQQTGAAAPKGLGLGGLGLGSKLPARPSQQQQQPNGTGAGEAASSSSRPAGGVGLLPPKPKPAAADAGAGAQQQQPARPAGGIGALPPKPGGAAPSAISSSSSTPAATAPQQPAAPRPAASSFRPVLPGRPAAVTASSSGGGGGALTVARSSGGASGPDSLVVNPDESKALQKLRARLQELRVSELAAGMRLGYSGAGPELQQWVGVLDRVEKVNAPPMWRKGDVTKAALAEATELNAAQGPSSPLPVNIKLLVVGMTGTGKSELINALLGRPALPTNAFRQGGGRVRTVKGRVAGMMLTCIDTPGLVASADAQSANRGTLRSIKAAWKRHKPHFLVYVDRLDAARPSFGEMGLLSSLTAQLGQAAWKKSLVVLTHANAARDKLGREYLPVVKQRKNITQNIIRQAAGEMQLRLHLHVVDTHPEGPRSPAGEALIYDLPSPMALAPSALPWRPALLLNLLGLWGFETAVDALTAAQPKKKGAKGGAAAGQKQDMFKQMMRSRLPPTSYFVEQLVEGVTKPEGWGVPEDPFGAETDDEEAEEFKHIYYKLMRAMAARGDPRAQKEYGLWLKKLERARKAYQEAYENEEVEQLAAYGYEGYVAEGLDLGPTFDPEDATDHRYQYVLADSPFAIMPTLDYYGFEHEDAITGFVAEWSGQPWNVDGWGGVPMDLTATIEKDKTTTCLQAEANASLVHSVAPFGSRHITQLTGAFELLRPNVKDILYTLEVNTFKDGLLKRNDHAGAGLLLTRMAENGNIRTGPVGVGVRIQEAMRLGPLKVEAVAAQVRGETPMGGRDEGWGARAFLLYDWIPGLAVNLDWYQERTKDEAQTIGGFASAVGYDCGLPGGYPLSLEFDWVSGSDVLHVDASLFSATDWKPAWLLLLPALNWAKDAWRRWRQRAPAGESELPEGEEDEDGAGMGMAGGDLGAMLQGMSGPDAQAMLQQLMQSGGLQQLMGARMA